MTVTCTLPNAREIDPARGDLSEEEARAVGAFEACEECGRSVANLLNAGARQWSWWAPDDIEAHLICEDCLPCRS